MFNSQLYFSLFKHIFYCLYIIFIKIYQYLHKQNTRFSTIICSYKRMASNACGISLQYDREYVNNLLNLKNQFYTMLFFQMTTVHTTSVSAGRETSMLLSTTK